VGRRVIAAKATLLLALDEIILRPISELETRHPQVRHGALLGLAAVLPARAAAGSSASLGASLQTQEQRQLAGLVAAVEAARLLRGRGGELMRAALCRCITAA
jgi:F420-0:gamma-glutamyl ligase